MDTTLLYQIFTDAAVQSCHFEAIVSRTLPSTRAYFSNDSIGHNLHNLNKLETRSPPNQI